MKTLLAPIPLLLSGILCVAQQNVTYTQSNKEVEYHYGVIADEDLPLISEIEKIKYEFRYNEKSITKKIDAQFNSYLEIKIDSDGYEQPWMELAKRFEYSPAGINLYDKNNQFMRTLEYSADEVAARDEIKSNIQNYGFHPGLSSFPDFTDAEIAELNNHGIHVQKDAEGVIKVEYPGNVKETYNPNLLTIIREWYDEDGIRTVETLGYEPYGTNLGFLPRIDKTEKFRLSVNGPCITEVKLKMYSGYQITDLGHFIDRATGNIDSLIIYPNPNNGSFAVEVLTEGETQIVSASIVNIMNGTEIPVQIGTSSIIQVNNPDLLPGNYIFRVTTNRSVLTTQFIKQ